MINMKSNDLPVFTPAGDYTLWGIFKLMRQYIIDNYAWQAESTQTGHEGRLRRIIRIAAPEHDTMSIDQYPASFPLYVRDAMKNRGQDVTGEDYEASTLDQYEHVARVVLKVAEAHYLRKRPSENEGAPSSRIHFAHAKDPVVRRFLHPQEELDLLKQVIPLLKRSGPARLFLIMMTCGFRENECCGFNWSMLKRDSGSEVSTIQMPQTTKIGKNTTKVGGKSENAPREIVVTDLIYDLLMVAKRELMNKWIASGNQPEQFENLPLGGTEKDYTTRCKTKDMTDFANVLFRKIGMRDDDLAALADDLMCEFIDRRASGLYADIEDYRSCTCYLARRCYATSLPVLGHDPTERQYSMGHDTGRIVDRRIFTSSPMRKRMKNLMSQKPLYNYLSDNRYVLKENQAMYFRGNTETLLLPADANNFLLDISTDEPGDILEIKIMQEDDLQQELSMSYRIFFSEPVAENERYPEEINVLHFYYQLYKDQIDEFNEWIRQYL